MTDIIFSTNVIRIGKEAAELLEEHKMLILFGTEIPEALEDACYIHDNNSVKEPIKPGFKLFIDETPYTIEKIGGLASENLAAIGHCTLNFRWDVQEDDMLEGSIYLSGKGLPFVKEGSSIRIYK